MIHKTSLQLFAPAAIAWLGSLLPAPGDSVAGKWQGEFDSIPEQQKYQLEFKVPEGKLEATAAAELRDEKRNVEFIDEKIEGDTITFAELRRIQDNEIRIEYTGKVTEKGISFTRKV